MNVQDHQNRHHGKRRRLGRGYTVVEVGISLTLFGIGAAAVVAMERTSVQGDADARQQDVATSIAGDWVARLQRDALNWKLLKPSGDTRAATTYLNNSYVTAMCGGGDSGISYTPVFVPPGTLSPAQTLTGNADGRSYAFDLFGHDLPVGSSTTPQTAYCAQVSECFEDALNGQLIQATVRVIWPRKLYTAGAAEWCSSSSSSTSSGGIDVDGGADAYRAVSMTVLLQGGAGQ